MDPDLTDRITGLNFGNTAGKETVTCEEERNASKVNRLPAIIEAVKSIKMTLETTEGRVSKLENRLDAMDEEVKRLRSSETSTSRDVGMELFTSVSRLEADTNRSIASTSQHDSSITPQMTPMRRTAPPSPKTMQIEMMEEEREEQQRALEQIEDCYEETRLWWAYSCLQVAF